jgi:hypothetical protein
MLAIKCSFSRFCGRPPVNVNKTFVATEIRPWHVGKFFDLRSVQAPFYNHPPSSLVGSRVLIPRNLSVLSSAKIIS